MHRMPKSRTTDAVAHTRIAILRSASATLRYIARYPVPHLLASRPQQVLDSYATSYSRSLESMSQQCARLARQWERALMSGVKSQQETQMSFNLQYLQLQNSMQNENRQFTMVSNIMKTKHETVKNSISNIR